MELPGYTAISGVLYIKGKAHPFHFGKLSNGQKPNDHTIYEIGSIAKTYTGLLLSQAVYDNKIKLDDDVRSYLGDKYPNLVLSNNEPITFRHLITHTSGLPPVINCNNNGQTAHEQAACFEHFTKADFFKELKNVKITDQSGKNYHYSSVGIQLVGYILENVYHSSFDDLFKKYIFSRFGDRNVFSELKSKENAQASVGKNSKGEPMPLINGFYRYAGGLKTTTHSMLNYIRGCLESNDKVIKQMMTRLTGDVQYGRAYAWNTFNYNGADKMLYHNGGTLGHSSWIALYPDQKIGIFIVTNVVTANSQSKLNELSNSIINQIKS
ncbi:MAG: beta-lactamase family protein [Sphingobacteriaceae bacterium]|nr:beta-lactamase family protein [Sphingobacteriaceae bacterium]